MPKITQCIEREDLVYDHGPHTLTGPPVQIYNPAFVTFIREMSNPCSTMEFSGVELDDALDFVDASIDLYEDDPYWWTEIHELRASVHLISLEVNLESKVIKPDGTTTTVCPTSERR